MTEPNDIQEGIQRMSDSLDGILTEVDRLLIRENRIARRQLLDELETYHAGWPPGENDFNLSRWIAQQRDKLETDHA